MRAAVCAVCRRLTHLSPVPSQGRLREDEGKRFFQQIVAGVTHLHAIGLCHLDLSLHHDLDHVKQLDL